MESTITPSQLLPTPKDSYLFLRKKTADGLELVSFPVTYAKSGMLFHTRHSQITDLLRDEDRILATKAIDWLWSNKLDVYLTGDAANFPALGGEREYNSVDLLAVGDDEVCASVEAHLRNHQDMTQVLGTKVATATLRYRKTKGVFVKSYLVMSPPDDEPQIADIYVIPHSRRQFLSMIER